MRPDLSAELQRLDALLPSRAPRAWAELGPPATAEVRSRLAEHSLGGALPADLERWFGWHDGQTGTSPIAPDSNYTLCSAQRALEVQAALSAPGADIQQPWDARWLPLLENGAGDYLIYAEGALIEYRHDDPARPQRWLSLAHWARAAASALAKVKPRKIPLPGVYDWTPAAALLGWQDGVRLDESSYTGPELGARYRAEIAALAALPTGAVLRYGAGRTHLALKLAPNRWLTCFGLDLDDALTQWTSMSDKPPSERSGYYCTDEALWSSLSSYFRGAAEPRLLRG